MITGVQLVVHILKEYGPLPQKKLQKLAYMAEIEYIRKHGERLTDLSFVKYYYGPYSGDITNIEDLDENIIIKEERNGIYKRKMSEFVNKDIADPIGDAELLSEIDSLIKPYASKNGSELEERADKTEPYLETENLKDTINLDEYAWFCNITKSSKFWDKAKRIDAANIKDQVYGKRVIKEDAELDSLFS